MLALLVSTSSFGKAQDSLPIAPIAIEQVLLDFMNQTWPGTQEVRVRWLSVEADISEAVGDVGEIQRNPVPTTISSDTLRAKNCTSGEQTFNETISVAVQEGLSTTVSRSVTTQRSVSAGINIPIPVATLTGGVQLSETVNVSRSETVDRRVTRTETRTVNRVILPGKMLFVRLQIGLYNGFLPFEGRIKVSGRATAQVRRPILGPRGPTGRYELVPYPAFIVNNEIQNVPLSQAHPPFIVSGSIANAQAREVDIVFAERDLDLSDPEDCPQLNNTPVVTGRTLLFRGGTTFNSEDVYENPLIIDTLKNNANEVTNQNFIGMPTNEFFDPLDCNAQVTVNQFGTTGGMGMVDFTVNTDAQYTSGSFEFDIHIVRDDGSTQIVRRLETWLENANNFFTVQHPILLAEVEAIDDVVMDLGTIKCTRRN